MLPAASTPDHDHRHRGHDHDHDDQNPSIILPESFHNISQKNILALESDELKNLVLKTFIKRTWGYNLKLD